MLSCTHCTWLVGCPTWFRAWLLPPFDLKRKPGCSSLPGNFQLTSLFAARSHVQCLHNLLSHWHLCSSLLMLLKATLLAESYAAVHADSYITCLCGMHFQSSPNFALIMEHGLSLYQGHLRS